MILETEVEPQHRLVWDLPVRAMHWLLAFATLGAWVTHYDLDDWFVFHVACGCVVLVVVVTRVVWGLVGTYHARFVNFVRGSGLVIRYLRNVAQSGGYAGHNPVGAMMVLLLLGLLLAQAVTGLFANDQIINTGPLSGYVSTAISDRLTGIHRLLSNIILVCVCTHAAAVFAHLLIKRENLILPMLTGNKPSSVVPERLAIIGSRTWLAIAIAAVVTAMLILFLYTAPKASLAF